MELTLDQLKNVVTSVERFAQDSHEAGADSNAIDLNEIAQTLNDLRITMEKVKSISPQNKVTLSLVVSVGVQ